MNHRKTRTVSDRLLIVGTACVLALGLIGAQPAFALTDFMYFTINGDSSLSTLTQTDTLSWTANCDTGSSVWWEIWYDVNSNSSIDAGTDVILGVISITDGDPNRDADGALNGWVQFPDLITHLHPGTYVLKGIDWSDESTIQGTVNCVAMVSPPNKITGTVTLEGHPPPDSAALKDILVWADVDGPNAQTGMTDENGYYEINIGPWGTGGLFGVQPTNLSGFSLPSGVELVVSGVTPNVNFHFAAAVDSVYGYLRAPEGFVRDIRGLILANTTSGGGVEKDGMAEAGRYAIHFAPSELGHWSISVDDEQFVPVFLKPALIYFSHDTLNSFRRDITLYKADTVIYARVLENGGLPSSNYLVDAWSSALSCQTSSVSGTGANNIAELKVSSWDMSNWNLAIESHSDDYPLPVGLIWDGIVPSGVSPGDTVTLNLIGGHLVSGWVTLDPGDPPPVWDDVWVQLWESESKNFGARPNGAGFFAITAADGSYWMSAWADGYLVDPSGRGVTVTGDTTGELDFMINKKHCRITGTLVNIPTPFNTSDVWVTAFTGSYAGDGYDLPVRVDSVTGTYEVYVCDETWTIWPWDFPGYDSPSAPVLAIGESPDTMRVVDLIYTPTGGCAVTMTGDVNNNGAIVAADIIWIVNYVFRAGPAPIPCAAAGDVNCNGAIVAADIIYLVNHVFRAGPAPCDVCTVIPGLWTCP